MIRFLLNNQLEELDDIAPNVSILDYLRLLRSRTGTKEGCAAGDCGACTVVIAELVDGALQYRACNACITPVGRLHAKQLITIEDLSKPHLHYQQQDDTAFLHPLQKLMVDCHASQCGFCTPGIVMS